MVKVRPGMTISADRAVLEQLRPERQRCLVGLEDDMWATFADRAEPYALVKDDGRLVGCCSVDAVHELHLFFVRRGFHDVTAEVFADVIDGLAISASLPSTVDPTFLSMSLARGGMAEQVALMYEHVADPVVTRGIDLRIATPADLEAAVAFDRAATGSPESFVRPYLAERIERRELNLADADGEIVATGECRVDGRVRGYAHLGLAVGSDRRGRGLGTAVMHALVGNCRAQGLAPLCSTEPGNQAAQQVIRRAGFRSRHQVLRVLMPDRA